MSVLDVAALIVIFLIIIAIAAVIVVLGSLPGKIAHKRGHPYPDAVNVASWIGLATGVFWPVAFIWAFLPVPGRNGAGAPAEVGADGTELTELRQRLEALEEETVKLRTQLAGDAS